MNTSKVVVGVLAGIAVGLLMGILFAPKKGSRTRKQIASKGEDYAEDIKEKIGGFADTLNKKHQSPLQKTESIIANGKPIQEDTKSETTSISGL